jgi:tRNA1(Val) A37 N6-methylase TrmN6
MNLSLRTRTQVYLGLYEREVHYWLVKLSSGVRTAIDLGANEGHYTLFFLQKTTAGKIFAFEPDANERRLMMENLSLNGIGSSERVEISGKWVGDRNTDSEVALDAIAPLVQTPCFIKMDVEQAEERVLRGATEINSMDDVRWLIETHSQELETSCIDILTKHGFTVKIIPNAWWRVILPECRGGHNRWLVAWKRL